jgi:hypothetical protein
MNIDSGKLTQKKNLASIFETPPVVNRPHLHTPERKESSANLNHFTSPFSTASDRKLTQNSTPKGNRASDLIKPLDFKRMYAQ